MAKPVEMAERKGVKSRLIDWDQFDPVEGYYECVSSRVSLQYLYFITRFLGKTSPTKRLQRERLSINVMQLVAGS